MPPRLTTRIKRQRLSALRTLRRDERATDSSLEVLERRINRILESKRPITPVTASSLVPLYRDFWRNARRFERSMGDFISFVSEQTAELLEAIE